MEQEKANIKRGKKWVRVRAMNTALENTKDNEWMEKQKSIQDDIKAYENSIKPVKTKPVKTKPVETQPVETPKLKLKGKGVK